MRDRLSKAHLAEFGEISDHLKALGSGDVKLGFQPGSHSGQAAFLVERSTERLFVGTLPSMLRKQRDVLVANMILVGPEIEEGFIPVRVGTFRQIKGRGKTRHSNALRGGAHAGRVHQLYADRIDELPGFTNAHRSVERALDLAMQAEEWRRRFFCITPRTQRWRDPEPDADLLAVWCACGLQKVA